MKAKIGDKVYTIFQDAIYLETVKFVGENSFLIDGFESKYDSEYKYDDYDETWFYDLEKAKTFLYNRLEEENPDSNIIVAQITDSLWEVYVGA